MRTRKRKSKTEDTRMKKQLYAIFDTCSGIYEQPHFANSDDMVRREFQDISTADGNPISKHPEHYSLWRLASFDNTTGKITDEKNECLWTALEAISQSQVVNQSEIKKMHIGIDPYNNGADISASPGGTA